MGRSSIANGIIGTLHLAIKGKSLCLEILLFMATYQNIAIQGH